MCFRYYRSAPQRSLVACWLRSLRDMPIAYLQKALRLHDIRHALVTVLHGNSLHAVRTTTVYGEVR